MKTACISALFQEGRVSTLYPLTTQGHVKVSWDTFYLHIQFKNKKGSFPRSDLYPSCSLDLSTSVGTAEPIAMGTMLLQREGEARVKYGKGECCYSSALSPESSFNEWCKSWKFCLAARKLKHFVCLWWLMESAEMNMIHNQLQRDDSMILNLTDTALYITTEVWNQQSLTRNNMWNCPLVQLCKRCSKFITLGRLWIKIAHCSERQITVLRETGDPDVGIPWWIE